MREIKFRGKRKDNGEWVYGSAFVGKFHSYIQTDSMFPVNSSIINGGWVEVIPETVGQYTNLKDKNGKKIYENDMLKKEHSTGYTLFTIHFGFYDNKEEYEDHESGYGWYLKAIKLFITNENKFVEPCCSTIFQIYKEQQFKENDVIIYGNIYDNPEFMNV